MNSVLSYLAGLLVLLLFAALVGPSVVDWNSFRGEIEGQFSSAAGRPVTIEGDINFVILPAPRFSLHRVKVGPDQERPGEALAEAETLEGEIALAPLLRGEIEITRIRVLNFVLRLRRDEDGNLDWASEQSTNTEAALDPETISLEAARFEGGTVVYLDADNDREFIVTDVSGDLKAVSLLGPLRLDGEVHFEDRPYSFSASIGVFGGDRAFPVNLEVVDAFSPWNASFIGLATDASAAARLDGTFLFEFGSVEAAAPEGETDPVVSMQAGVVISRKEASLREIELTVEGSVLKGQAELSFEDTPALSAEFSGARLQVDKVLHAFSQFVPSGPTLYFPEALTGSLAVSIGDLGFGALNATGVSSHMTFENGVVTLQSLSGFPGNTTTELTGEVSFVQGVPRFDGALNASVGSLPVFGRWLDNRLSGEASNAPVSEESADGIVEYGGPTQLRLQTDLALQSSLLQAYGLSAVFGNGEGELAPVTGGISFARSSRPALGVELSGPLLDLNFLRSLVTPPTWEHFPDVSKFDASIVVSMDEFRAGDWVLHGVDLAAALSDGLISIEKLEASQHDVVSDDLVGSIAITGSLREPGSFAHGGLQGKVSSDLVVDWIDHNYGWSMPPMENEGNGDLDFTVRGTRENDRHTLSLDLSGSIGHSDASLAFKQIQATGAAEMDQIDLLVLLENQTASELTAQIGLGNATSISGEGTLQFQLSGGGAGPFDVTARLRAGSTSLSASGSIDDPWDALKFEGRFEASSDQVDHVFAVLDWQSPLVALAIGNGRQGAFIAGGGLAWTPERISVSELEAVAGSFRVSGSATYLETETVPRIDADIELGRITLDPLFATDDGSLWNAAPLNWQALAELQGTVDVSASSVDVAGLSFAQVQANGSLAEGVLSFNPVTARFADGRLMMGGKFEGGEGVPGVGFTVALEDADIATTSNMIFAAPLGDGSATASLQLQGQGRSLLGLVSTLSGKGSLTLGPGHFSGFDLSAFREGLGGLTSMDDFAPLVEVTLEQSATSFERVEGELQLEDGILNFTPVSLSVVGAREAKIKALADLVRLETDVESSFVFEGEPTLPRLTMVLAGPLHEQDRRTDTLAIQSAIAQILLMRELEAAGVEEIPAELRELFETPMSEDNLDAPLDEVAEELDEATVVPVPALAETPAMPLPIVRPTP